MKHTAPLATYEYSAAEPNATLEFLKRTRSELRELRHVRVFKERLQILDVNRDCFEILGVGYPDAGIVALLRAINTAFDPETIHKPTEAEYKEFATGRRHTWAEDRLM